jgi:hypothetical protein
MSSEQKEQNNETINKEQNNDMNNDNFKEGGKKLKSKFNLLEQGRLKIIGNEEESSKNIIIIGPKGSGKSTIFSFLTSDNSNTYYDNGTSGINYGFMRSKDKNKVINIFEIGSGIENLFLIKTLLNNDNIESTIVLLILDFEDPGAQLTNLQNFIFELKLILTNNIDKNILEENTKNKLALLKSNKNVGDVQPLPVETYVIGNKYELLGNKDINESQLTWLCKTMRYFCFINALNLIFYSSFYPKKDLKKILKDTILEMCFSGRRLKYTQKNSIEPLYINYYNDNLDDIGQPKISVTVTSDMNQRWIETYKGTFKNYKTAEKKNREIDLDENLYQIYKETKIDNELMNFNDFKDKNKDNINKFNNAKTKVEINKYKVKKK